MAARNSRLPLFLAGLYTLLAYYGSLYPFHGWRDSGAGAFDFLLSGWPRYFTGFDIAVNVLAYLPFGFVWAAALAPRLGSFGAFLAAGTAGMATSLGIEGLQNYLPTRVPSNLDWACNSLGSLLGATAGLRWGHQLIDGGRLHVWRQRHFLRGQTGDIGLLLVAFWLLTQLNPETFLFGNGNLRSLLGLPAPLEFAASRFTALEAGTVAAQTLAIALIGGCLVSTHSPKPALLLILAAISIKSFAIMLLMESVNGFAWATPGTLVGLALGLLLWTGGRMLPATLQQALAAMALMLAAVLANLMPDNPYLENTLRVWQQGHFLNFNGLTRLTSSLWPFLALPWLMLTRSLK